MNLLPIKNPVLDDKGFLTDPWRKWFEEMVGRLPATKFRSVIYTESKKLTSEDFGKVVKFNNGSSNVVCTLPSVDVSDIDSFIFIMRLGTGKLYIQAADDDTIESSGAGGRIECSEAGRICANLMLYLATETKWAILAGTGIFPVW